MLDPLGCEQSAGLHEISIDSVVGRGVVHACELARVGGLEAAVVHGNDDINVVLLAGVVVVGTEAGGGMHAARTRIHGDVICHEQNTLAIQERMLSGHELEVLTLEAGDDLVRLNPALQHSLAAKSLGHDVGVAVSGLSQHVILDGIESDGQVAGQSPGGCGPDHEIGLVKIGILTQEALIVCDLELDVDGGAGIGLILDLGLGQRGLALGAPVHGLQTLVDVALLVHLTEHLDLARLKHGIHGQIGVVPVGAHAQTDELLLLYLHVLLCKLVAGGTELGNGHLLAVQLVLLDDGRLDGHAVVVPAGDVGHAVALHGLGLVDEVLEDLVERSAHMNVAVGEGRAVVKQEGRLLCALGQHGVVKIHLLPVAQGLGLALGEVRPHGKFGLREIEGAVVVLGHGFGSPYV